MKVVPPRAVEVRDTDESGSDEPKLLAAENIEREGEEVERERHAPASSSGLHGGAGLEDPPPPPAAPETPPHVAPALPPELPHPAAAPLLDRLSS